MTFSGFFSRISGFSRAENNVFVIRVNPVKKSGGIWLSYFSFAVRVFVGELYLRVTSH